MTFPFHDGENPAPLRPLEAGVLSSIAGPVNSATSRLNFLKVALTNQAQSAPGDVEAFRKILDQLNADIAFWKLIIVADAKQIGQEARKELNVIGAESSELAGQVDRLVIALEKVRKSTPAPPSLGETTFVEKNSSFSIDVPPGWTADGTLLEIDNGRYVVFNVIGPGNGLVFSGHPDLPQRYIVPDPSHGFLQSGRRTKFGNGPTQQHLFPGVLSSAPQMCLCLAKQRFGEVFQTFVTPLPDMVAETRRGAESGGLQDPYVDACMMEFASPDGNRVGMIKLVVFGYGYPCGTWQVESISGYHCSTVAKETTAQTYKSVMDSLKIGQAWASEHPNKIPQAFHDVMDQKTREADQTDMRNLKAHREQVSEIMKGMLENVKGRQHG
ncbi:hypothetical protein BH11VER1_BH11VER1_07170 [soil metagenome]